MSSPSAAERINSVLGDLDLQWQYQPTLSIGIGYATSNVWSRAARRKKDNLQVVEDVVNDEEDEDEEPAIGFKVHLKAAEIGQVVQVRWLRGKDSVLFESFCGMLKRQMTA